MKFINYQSNEQYRLGIRTDYGILDVLSAAECLDIAEIPATTQEVIERGEEGLKLLRSLEEKAMALKEDLPMLWLNEDELKLGPCVINPEKIICVGLNYRKHAEETGASVPEFPILFNKFNNALAANSDEIVLPRGTEKVDYEAELVIVIGKQARFVSKDDSLDYVFGYCNANDVSARDWQVRTSQWLLGKTSDGFAPIGPYLVTSDEVANPNELYIRTYVNGEIRQSSSTNDMIFYCNEIVSYISQYFTLKPGDIILTGTPEGVVLGYPPEKQVYLQDGDLVTVEIENLGSLSNRFVNPTL